MNKNNAANENMKKLIAFIKWTVHSPPYEADIKTVLATKRDAIRLFFVSS